MLTAFLSFVFSFGITFLSLPAIITIAGLKNLCDLPDHRKVHKTPIASLGGVGIFAGFIIALLVSLNFLNAIEFQFYAAAAVVIFFLGLKDDILIISPTKKFIGELLATLLIVFKGGLYIENMHGIFGIYELPFSISVLISSFTILVIINAFNLIDGIDGLAGSLGLMVTAFLGWYFLKVHNSSYAILSLSLAGSLIAFLYFNFQPAKIFMGDTGSLLVGLICSILVVKFINVASNSLNFPVVTSPAIGFSLLVIPLLDTLRVFSIRIRKHCSPFMADKNHIHHLLLDLGLSHKVITLSLVGYNTAMVVLGYSLRGIGDTWTMAILTGLFFSAISVVNLLRYKKQTAIRTKQVSHNSGNVIILREPNVQSINEAFVVENEGVSL